jgi:hypothetical protein
MYDSPFGTRYSSPSKELNMEDRAELSQIFHDGEPSPVKSTTDAIKIPVLKYSLGSIASNEKFSSDSVRAALNWEVDQSEAKNEYSHVKLQAVEVKKPSGEVKDKVEQLRLTVEKEYLNVTE